MANGNKRILGKVAREKIGKAFPDWLTPAPKSATEHRADETRGTYNLKPHHTRNLVQRLCNLAEKIDDTGLQGLIEVAKCFCKTHPAKQKPKAA